MSGFDGYDSFYHIYWIREWHKLWELGFWYPRWLPNSYHQYGAPSFYFYAPFSFFLTSAIYSCVPNADPATIAKITIALTLIGSGVSMWLYLQYRQKNIYPNIVASLLYTFALYRYFDHSIRSAFSEHVSLVFVPLAFWGLEMSLADWRKQHRGYGFALLSISIALLFITNPASATITLIGLAVFTAVLVRSSRIRDGMMLAIAVIMAVALAAFYLFPAFAFVSNIQLGRIWHAPSIIHSSPMLAIFTGIDVTISVVSFLTVIAAAILIVGLLRDRVAMQGNSLFKSSLWVLGIVIFLCLPVVSRDLFNSVPPFTLMQRPERLGLLVLFVATLLWQNELVARGSKSYASIVVILWSVSAVVLVAVQVSGFRIHPKEYWRIDDGIGFRPQWVRTQIDTLPTAYPPFSTDAQAIAWKDKQSVVRVRSVRAPISDTIDYTLSRPAVATIHRYFWTDWRATVDGKMITLSADSFGRITVPTEAGMHEIILSQHPNPIVRLSLWISVCALLFLPLLSIAVSRYFAPARD